MAKLIAFGNQKGGVGKTTLTINVAGALMHAGKTVTIMDVDKQQRSILDLEKEYEENTSWVVRREKNGLPPFAADVVSPYKKGGDVEREMMRMMESGHLDHIDYLLVDMPPDIESELTRKSLKHADMVVVPFNMSREDIGSTLAYIAMLENEYIKGVNPGLQFITVPNGVDAKARVTQSILEDAANAPATKAVGAIMGRREAFRLASELTVTVHDLPKGTALLAVRETDALCRAILERLGDSITTKKAGAV